jgi:quercetin dioxygenase-like cupin family protein
MDVRSLAVAEAFTTADGSTIRELCGLPTGGTINQSLAEATLEAGQGTQRHYHHETEEIYFVLAGELQVRLGDEVEVLCPYDAVRIPAETVRAVRNDGDEEARFLMCSVRVEDPRAESVHRPGFWRE